MAMRERDRFEELHEVLGRMARAHEAWLVAIGEHRCAIARADMPKTEAGTRAQREAMATIAELEARREALTASICAGPRGMTIGGRSVSIAAVARLAPESMRSGLIAQAQRLRELVERTRREQEMLRVASAALGAHMEGLVRQVVARLQRAATYTASGLSSARITSTGVDLVQ